MALTVRRVLARVVVAAAASAVAITLARQCEAKGGGTIAVEVDVSGVDGARAVHLELRRGRTVVATLDRRLDGGLGRTIHLDGPALGADGEVRIEVETDAGLRRVRRPLVAPGGSTVTIRCGEGADLE